MAFSVANNNFRWSLSYRSSPEHRRVARVRRFISPKTHIHCYVIDSSCAQRLRVEYWRDVSADLEANNINTPFVSLRPVCFHFVFRCRGLGANVYVIATTVVERKRMRATRIRMVSPRLWWCMPSEYIRNRIGSLCDPVSGQTP